MHGDGGRGAVAFVGDDGAADYQEPAGTGFLHGLHDAVVWSTNGPVCERLAELRSGDVT
jgi:hypothetical protein